ncbi:helix-turn-helix domain-containing protein [Thalassobaculum sp.]|uniref:helix-turn-helix domain-containing protein n=1 Tax=Thalassobaculum sp. TaxID=2022740 RepID=UPI0032ED1054
MTNPSQKLLTVREAAAALQLSSKTIYRAVESGDLPHHRFGRAVRIGLADLEAFANRHRSGGLFQ